MAFAVLSGLELTVVNFSAGPPIFRGETVRAFDNTLLDGADAKKRTWELELYGAPEPYASTLRSLDEGLRTFYGDVLGTGIEDYVYVKVRIARQQYGPDVSGPKDDWTSHSVRFTLALEEV
jgi:hypothetical protein